MRRSSSGSDTLDVLDHRVFTATGHELASASSINFLGIGASGAIAQDANFRFMKLGVSTYALTGASRQLARAEAKRGIQE